MNERGSTHSPLHASMLTCQPELFSQRPAILVLGMHRSGTSAVSGVIDASGAAGPKALAPANEWNLRGYFESPRIFDAHDELLAAVGSRWDDWRQLDPVQFGTAAEQRLKLACVYLTKSSAARP